MKAALLTFSQTGNTLKVGRAIEKGLTASGVEVQHHDFLNRKKFNPADADLIGLGAPVFENQPAPVVDDFLKAEGIDLTGKKAFTYITSGGSPAKSLWRLGQSAADAGAQPIAGIQIRGTSTFPTLFGLIPGRPNAEDLSLAESFGVTLARHLLDQSSIPPQFHLSKDKGGSFYDLVGPLARKGKMLGIPLPACDHGICKQCRTCVKECPTESIALDKQKGIWFSNTCIRCYRCWHICPEMAINMKHSPGSGLGDRLLYSHRMELWFGDLDPNEEVGTNLYQEVLARKVRLKHDKKEPLCEWETVGTER